jgi:hypothetical protein
MTPQETIAHLQSQLDECRKERDEAKRSFEVANSNHKITLDDLMKEATSGGDARVALAASQAELAGLREGRSCILPQTQQHARNLYTVAVACLKTYRDDPEAATAKERQARELAEGEVDVMREALEKVFHYLGRQIKAKTLNESAKDGTQSLSLEVAQLLDGKKP